MSWGFILRIKCVCLKNSFSINHVIPKIKNGQHIKLSLWVWYIWDGESGGRRVWEDPFELEGLEGAGVLDFLQLHKGDPSTSFFRSHFFNCTLVSFPLFKFSIFSFMKLSCFPYM